MALPIVKTPGVIYRAQKRLDSTVRMLGDLSENEKELVAAGASSALSSHYKMIMKEGVSSLTGISSAEVRENDGPFEHMKASFKIERHQVEVGEDIKQAISILEQLDTKDLRKLLGRMVDESESLEVLTPTLFDEHDGTTDAMRVAHRFIPENASIRMSGFVFMAGQPDVAVFSRIRAYRAGAIPTPAFPDAEETLNSVSQQGAVGAARKFLERGEDNSAVDRLLIMTEGGLLDFSKAKNIVDSIAQSIVRANENNDNLSDEIHLKLDGEIDDEHLDAVVNCAVDSLLAVHGPEYPDLDRVLRDFEDGNDRVTEKMMEALARSKLDPSSLDLSNEIIFAVLSALANDDENMDFSAIEEEVISIIRRGEPDLLEQPQLDARAEAETIVSSIYETLVELANRPEAEAEPQPSM